MSARMRGKIKTPRRGLTTGDPVDFDTMWASLSSSLREIHSKNSSELSFEQLYRCAYRLVLKKEGERLYNKVSELERDWLRNHVLPKVVAVISTSLYSESGTNANVTERRVAGERLLRELKTTWEDYRLSMNMTTDVLMYLDRAYCTDHNRTPMFNTAMGFFRDTVLRAPLPTNEDLNIGKVLSEVMLYQIQLERSGELIDRSLLRACVYMLEGLYETDDEEESTRLYLTSFEPAFLRASATFYSEEAKRLLTEVDASSFCRQVKRRIIEESDRCHSALSTLTLAKIKQVIDDDLIKASIHDVIGLPGSGVKFMLDNDRFHDLEMMYDLNARVDPKKTDLEIAIQERITEQGNAINELATSHARQSSATNAQAASAPGEESADVNGSKSLALGEKSADVNGGEKPAPGEKSAKANDDKKATPLNPTISAAIQWVQGVLQLKEKYDTVLKLSLKNDPKMQTSMTRSFNTFINSFPRNAEYLSLFFDDNMKTGIKGKTENEVDEIIDKGITLLRFIHDKDIFEEYYKKHLCRRLLMKRTISMDAERQMISKMKMVVGNTFTQRIEAMFKDMAVSEDLTAAYRAHTSKLGKDTERADLEVHVLTSTMWPLEALSASNPDEPQQAEPIYPSVIDRVRVGFEKFYLNQHNGRRLKWEPSMGGAVLRAVFPKCKGDRKDRELHVSTYAMMILLLFNDLDEDESLSFEEIQARTGIPTSELARNLQSISVAPKHRILIKEPMSKDVKPDDQFRFNATFYSPFHRLRIGTIAGANRVEDSVQRRQTEKRNEDARAAYVDAAIVRIMKSREVLSHANLMRDVIAQLSSRFMPKVSMIKMQIETLIDREYIERKEGSTPAAYAYIA